MWNNTEYFNLLYCVPALIVIAVWWWRRRHKSLQQHLGAQTLKRLMPGLSPWRRRIKLALQSGVLILLVLTLARLQTGRTLIEGQSLGIELMFLVDVSQSMLAEDVRPNRLSVAKNTLSQLARLRAGDRIGVVAFAGSAAVVSPLTSDGRAIQMYLDDLSPSSLSAQGTNFKLALEQAAAAFKRGGLGAEQPTITQAIVIVSDGEDNEPGALQQADELQKQGIYTFSLAVGTAQGGPVPSPGATQGPHLRDRNNQLVISKSKGTVLKALAQKGQGSFYHARAGRNIRGQRTADEVNHDLQQLSQSKLRSSRYVDYNEWFQVFLLAALLLAGLELLLPYYKRAK